MRWSPMTPNPIAERRNAQERRKLALIIAKTLSAAAECDVRYETILVCWGFPPHHDSESRKELIASFAEEHG